MKTYTITFMASATLTIPADSVDEARTLFEECYQEDAGRALAMTNIEVTDVQEEDSDDVESETISADSDADNADTGTEVDNGEANIKSVGDKVYISKKSVIDKIDKLIQDNEKNFAQNPAGYEKGYAGDRREFCVKNSKRQYETIRLSQEWKKLFKTKRSQKDAASATEFTERICSEPALYQYCRNHGGNERTVPRCDRAGHGSRDG